MTRERLIYACWAVLIMGNSLFIPAMPLRMCWLLGYNAQVMLLADRVSID